MAKKTRRVRTSTTKSTSPAQSPINVDSAEIDTPTPVVTTTKSKPAKVTRADATAEEFQVEYAYVLKDLRLVFVLAGILFALLIAINLFLQ